MWSYYGSKSKVIDYYPAPVHKNIIEPFAGSARYSLRFFENDITLIDKYEIIVGIWKYLQQCSPKDILSLPTPAAGSKINRDDFDCIEQAWLMGFLISQGNSFPMITVSPWGSLRIKSKKKFIADQLFKIKHWKILLGDYKDLDNKKATWFIDPPYKHGGNKYRHPNTNLNFGELGEWCKQRKGQVIVCENTKAKWLPFKPMKEMNGCRQKTTEAIWTNYLTAYDNEQLKLIA